jgi:molybdenum cofactor guanylyltransferase
MFPQFPIAGNPDNTICEEFSLNDLRNRAAWILAGGRSSRMGTDKALLEIDGQPLVAHVADTVSKVCGPVAIVGDPGRYGDLALSMRLRVIPDSHAGQGPLAGIEAALSATNCEANLVVACDMPNLDPGILEELFAVQTAFAADCVVPQYADRKTEPICAVYRRRCHSPIQEALESGVRSVIEAHRFLEARGFALRYLPVTQSDRFANLNTPNDVERYRHG